jgi:hypothetical protein
MLERKIGVPGRTLWRYSTFPVTFIVGMTLYGLSLMEERRSARLKDHLDWSKHRPRRYG